MVIRNLHWYNQNEARTYPVDETATSFTSGGDRLPSTVISDLNLRYPRTFGEFPFIGAVTVTDTLVTVMIQVALTIDSTTAVGSVRYEITVGNIGIAITRIYTAAKIT